MANLRKFRVTALHIGLALSLLTSGSGLAHGDLHTRIALISREIETQPQNAQLFVRRADLERQHENWRAAMMDYDQAIRLEPTLNLDSPRGRTLLEAGFPKEALPLLERVVQRSPDDPQALLFYARTLAKLDRPREAAKYFRDALAHAPVSEPAWVIETANAMVVAGLEHEAAQILSTGIAKIGAHPALVLRLMDLAVASHDFDTALAQVEILRRAAPSPEPWMAQRAAILAQAGRRDESRAAWQEFIRHLNTLPNLERGSPVNLQLMKNAHQSLTALDHPPDKPESSCTK